MIIKKPIFRWSINLHFRTCLISKDNVLDPRESMLYRGSPSRWSSPCSTWSTGAHISSGRRRMSKCRYLLPNTNYFIEGLALLANTNVLTYFFHSFPFRLSSFHALCCLWLCWLHFRFGWFLDWHLDWMVQTTKGPSKARLWNAVAM